MPARVHVTAGGTPNFHHNTGTKRSSTATDDYVYGTSKHGESVLSDFEVRLQGVNTQTLAAATSALKDLSSDADECVALLSKGPKDPDDAITYWTDVLRKHSPTAHKEVFVLSHYQLAFAFYGKGQAGTDSKDVMRNLELAQHHFRVPLHCYPQDCQARRWGTAALGVGMTFGAQARILEAEVKKQIEADNGDAPPSSTKLMEYISSAFDHVDSASVTLSGGGYPSELAACQLELGKLYLKKAGVGTSLAMRRDMAVQNFEAAATLFAEVVDADAVPEEAPGSLLYLLNPESRANYDEKERLQSARGECLTLAAQTYLSQHECAPDGDRTAISSAVKLLKIATETALHPGTGIPWCEAKRLLAVCLVEDEGVGAVDVAVTHLEEALSRWPEGRSESFMLHWCLGRTLHHKLILQLRKGDDLVSMKTGAQAVTGLKRAAGVLMKAKGGGSVNKKGSLKRLRLAWVERERAQVHMRLANKCTKDGDMEQATKHLEEALSVLQNCLSTYTVSESPCEWISTSGAAAWCLKHTGRLSDATRVYSDVILKSSILVHQLPLKNNPALAPLGRRHSIQPSTSTSKMKTGPKNSPTEKDHKGVSHPTHISVRSLAHWDTLWAICTGYFNCQLQVAIKTPGTGKGQVGDPAPPGIGWQWIIDDDGIPPKRKPEVQLEVEVSPEVEVVPEVAPPSPEKPVLTFSRAELAGKSEEQLRSMLSELGLTTAGCVDRGDMAWKIVASGKVLVLDDQPQRGATENNNSDSKQHPGDHVEVAPHSTTHTSLKRGGAVAGRHVPFTPYTDPKTGTVVINKPVIIKGHPAALGMLQAIMRLGRLQAADQLAALEIHKSLMVEQLLGKLPHKIEKEGHRLHETMFRAVEAMRASADPSESFDLPRINIVPCSQTYNIPNVSSMKPVVEAVQDLEEWIELKLWGESPLLAFLTAPTTEQKIPETSTSTSTSSSDLLRSFSSVLGELVDNYEALLVWVCPHELPTVPPKGAAAGRGNNSPKASKRASVAPSSVPPVGGVEAWRNLCGAGAEEEPPSVTCIIAYREEQEEKHEHENNETAESNSASDSGVLRIRVITATDPEAATSNLKKAVSGWLEASHSSSLAEKLLLTPTALADLASTLNLDPIIALLPLHIRDICMIPLGIASLVPFHALPLWADETSTTTSGPGKTVNLHTKSDLENAPRLIDRFAVRYCSSLYMLEMCARQASSTSTPHYFDGCCCVADPFGNMKLASTEVAVCNAAWGGDKERFAVMRGEKATAEGFLPGLSQNSNKVKESQNSAFYKGLKKARCLHVACPIEYNNGSTAIRLRSNHGKPGSGTNTVPYLPVGTSTLLSNLNLKHCSLVILSRGASLDEAYNIRNNSDICMNKELSLPDTLLVAGAQSVLQRMWSNDGVCALDLLFILLFHRALKGDSISGELRPVSTALREAMVFIKGATAEEIYGALEVTEGLDPSSISAIRDGIADLISGRTSTSNPAPFSNPVYWASYHAIGSCGLVRSIQSLQVDNPDDVNIQNENHNNNEEEVEEGGSHMSARDIKKAARAAAGALGDDVSDQESSSGSSDSDSDSSSTSGSAEGHHHHHHNHETNNSAVLLNKAFSVANKLGGKVKTGAENSRKSVADAVRKQQEKRRMSVGSPRSAIKEHQEQAAMSDGQVDVKAELAKKKERMFHRHSVGDTGAQVEVEPEKEKDSQQPNKGCSIG